MNFANIPGADWPFGFSAVLLAMIGTMAVALWWFRRKGWL
jgi:Mg2+ and Co2+ transporter CorA